VAADHRQCPAAARFLHVPVLERDGDVFLIRFDPDDENRFHPDWLGVVEGLLDEVEKASPAALVTIGSGKFWSNGLDLTWLIANGDKAGWYVDQVHGLFARVLASPVPTVAALNGHCFAAGAMFALAHDYRIMRADRGFFCLPEVDINIPFTDGMAALIQSRLLKQTAHEAMTTGRRYGGADALAAGIVQAAVGEAEVESTARVLVEPLAGKANPTRTAIKATMYRDVLATLRTPSGALAVPGV
jgi:enoyl-CoA hydratase/carnithine racemase